jgi:alpha-ketoglutarate-dependent 2,4-dichlorophenoxyacetate dioxygenase
MWDNRFTLHRGRRFDLTKRRDLRRTTTMQVDVVHADTAPDPGLQAQD